MTDSKFTFTQATVARLAPTGRRVYYGDLGQRGLFVSVTPSGQKAFYVVRKVQGRTLRIHLGRFDPDLPGSREIPAGTDPLSFIGHAAALNVRMARALAAAVNAQLDRGLNPATEERQARRAAAAELTLREAFERYYSDHLIPQGRRTAESLREDFARYLGTVAPAPRKPRGRVKVKAKGAVDWETKKLSALQPADLRRMMAALRAGTGARTANKAFVLVRSIYRKMREWQLYTGDNPCDGIAKFPERERARFLRSDELPAFFAALARHEHETFRHFVLLSLLTGARRSNVQSMRWADLDFAAGLWTIPGEKSKNGDLLTVPLTAPALAILAARRNNGSPWVFPARSKSGHLIDASHHWKALLQAANLSDLRLHDLRRSLGSWAAMQGASLTVIGAALGHKSTEATRIYARLQSDPVREAMERAQQAMFAHGGVTAPGEVTDLDKKRRK